MRPAVVGVLLLMAVPLLLAGSVQAYSAAGPRYTKGDTWSYALSGNVASPPGPLGGVSLNLSGTRTLRIVDVVGSNVTTEEVARLRVAGHFSFGGTPSDATLTVNVTLAGTRTASNGTFYVNVSSQAGFLSTTSSFHGSFHVASTILRDTLVYPLESGQRYTTVARVE